MASVLQSIPTPEQMLHGHRIECRRAATSRAVVPHRVPWCQECGVEAGCCSPGFSGCQQFMFSIPAREERVCIPRDTVARE